MRNQKTMKQVEVKYNKNGNLIKYEWDEVKMAYLHYDKPPLNEHFIGAETLGADDAWVYVIGANDWGQRMKGIDVHETPEQAIAEIHAKNQ